MTAARLLTRRHPQKLALSLVEINRPIIFLLSVPVVYKLDLLVNVFECLRFTHFRIYGSKCKSVANPSFCLLGVCEN